MKGTRSAVLRLTSGIMMISCLHAAAGFLLACFARPPLCPARTAAVLMLSAALTRLLRRRRRHPLTVFGTHAAGFGLAVLWLFHRFFFRDRGPGDWLLAMLLLGCVWMLWRLGRKLAGQTLDQATIQHRFDIGLACFAGILLIKLLLAVKGVATPLPHSVTAPFLSFLITGLFAMGFIRAPESSPNAEVSPAAGAAVLLIFIAVVFLAGGGLALVFMPTLQTAAQTGAGLLKTLSGPLEEIIIVMARLFLKSGLRRSAESGASGGFLPGTSDSTAALGIFHYLFITLAVLLLTAMAVGLLLLLFKWLLKKIRQLSADSAIDRGGAIRWAVLLSALPAAVQAFIRRMIRVFHPPDPCSVAMGCHRRLLRWGRRSGLRPSVCETPREYGLRLAARFPRVEKEIRQVIAVHAQTFYGDIVPDRDCLRRTRRALKKMHRPSLWLARFKSIFIPA